MNLAVKIYNKYGGEIYSVLKENPYRMADDIDGVGFNKVILQSSCLTLPVSVLLFSGLSPVRL